MQLLHIIIPYIPYISIISTKYFIHKPFTTKTEAEEKKRGRKRKKTKTVTTRKTEKKYAKRNEIQNSSCEANIFASQDEF